MAILFVGIDLAKNVFAIHGVDEHGKAVLVRPSVQRARLHQLVAALPPCTIGMEACSGAHHWARLFAQHGHTVRKLTASSPGHSASRRNRGGRCGPTRGTPSTSPRCDIVILVWIDRVVAEAVQDADVLDIPLNHGPGASRGFGVRMTRKKFQSADDFPRCSMTGSLLVYGLVAAVLGIVV